MAKLLSPRQLGYRVCGGAKAAIHASRKFLQDLPSEHGSLHLANFNLNACQIVGFIF